MQLHEIPTHLEVEDPILGPLTTHDALYLLVGGAAVYWIGTEVSLVPWAHIGLGSAAGLVAVAFALVKVRGRPLESWLFAGLMYLASPRVAVWHPATAHLPREALASAWHPRRPRVLWGLEPMNADRGRCASCPMTQRRKIGR
jgi:hypothetical protein